MFHEYAAVPMEAMTKDIGRRDLVEREAPVGVERRRGLDQAGNLEA
jgi:hypothetical protein